MLQFFKPIMISDHWRIHLWSNGLCPVFNLMRKTRLGFGLHRVLWTLHVSPRSEQISITVPWTVIGQYVIMHIAIFLSKQNVQPFSMPKVNILFFTTVSSGPENSCTFCLERKMTICMIIYWSMNYRQSLSKWLWIWKKMDWKLTKKPFGGKVCV